MFACREVLELSEAFIDRELLPEGRAWIMHHLVNCAECTALLDMKIGLKRLLRHSVRKVIAPVRLEHLVRMQRGA